MTESGLIRLTDLLAKAHEHATAGDSLKGTGRMTDKLRERSRAFLEKMFAPMMPVDRSEVDDLVDFVLSEIGRAADERLGDAAPLVLYFADDTSRRELVEAIMEAKPGMIARAWPK